jgi:hypothetical protein
MPGMRGDAGELARPHDMVYGFLPTLPGRAMDVGGSWTDTIDYVADLSGGESRSSAVVTYTVQGDTAVAGASLRKVTFQGRHEVTENSVMAETGAEMVREYSGELTGMFLWDLARGVMAVRESMEELEGTVEIPMAGMPAMPMRLTVTSRARLQEN